MKQKNSSRFKMTNKQSFFWGSFLLFVLWMIWGNITFEVTHFTIEGENLPAEFDGYKIAHVSDLHNKNWNGRLLKALRKENPDLIAITGDLIDSQKINLEEALKFAEEAQKVAPVYYVTGNQEAVSVRYPSLEKGLRDLDVVILEDEAELIEDQGEMLLLGIHDPLFMIGEIPTIEHEMTIKAKIDEMTADFEGFTILLSHRPELFDLYTEKNLDLILTGHAHGGQFRLPFVGGVYAPDQGFFPTYTNGLYEEGSTRMIVSRGLGNSVIPIRFNNRQQLIFLHIQSKH